MNKAIKWILIIIAGLIGLIVSAMISLPFIIDPNDYKEKISQQVHKQTGRDLSIPGDIKLQISPRLDVSFTLGEISLASNRDFSDTPFASSKLAEIKLALWPLLSQKQLQVNSIVLQQVKLNLIRNTAGRGNWQDLTTSDESKKTEHAQITEKEQPAQAAGKSPMSIDVGGVDIKDINVHYTDQQSGKIISLENFNLNVGHLKEGERFPIKADFTLKMVDKQQQPLTATVATRGNLTLLLAKKEFIIEGFNLKGLFQGKIFPSAKLDLELSSDAEIYALDEKIIVKKFIVKQGDLTAETTLTLAGFKTPSIEGTLTIPSYSPKSHLKELGLPLPQFADPEVLNRLAISLGFSLNGDQLNLKDMKMEIDDTTINTTASVNNLQHPAYTLFMQIDQIDLDRYAVIQPDTPQKDTPRAPEQKTQKDQAFLPIHLLRDLAFSADIKVNALKAAKLRMSDIILKTSGKDGLISLQPLSANLYDGTLNVTGKINARKEIPEIQLNKVMRGVQLGSLFVDMIGREELSGKADIRINLISKGIDKNQLVRNSNGTVKLSLADGRIARLKILQTIRLAKALLDKKAPALESTEQPTGFATLTASGTLRNGVFTNNDLLARSDLMKVSGKGNIDLVNEQVDYLLTVYLTDRVERDENTGLVALGNTPIPYRVKGSFTELEQSAAIEELVKAKAQEVLLDELQKHLETGSDKKGTPDIDAGSLIQKSLQGIFGN